MQDEMNAPRAQQRQIVIVEIMGDVERAVAVEAIEGCQHRAVAAADRIGGIDVGVGGERCVRQRAGFAIATMPLADLDDPDCRIVLTQHSAKADLPLFLAAEAAAG
ncbi:hypothetical protein D9M72_595790 [compost metagenome]